MPESTVTTVVNPAPPTAVSTPVVPVPNGTDITGVTPAPAPGTQPEAKPSETVPGTEGTKTPETVPYDRFSEVIASKNQLAEQVQKLQAQIKVMEDFYRQGVPGQPAVQPTAPEAPASMFDQAIKEIAGDDPYLNRDQVGKVLTRFEQAISAKLAEITFMSQNPDYHEIVNGKPDSPLVQALQLDPGFAQVIRSSPTPMQTAYLIGKRFGKAPVASATAPVPPTPPTPPPLVPPVVPTIGGIGGRGNIGGKPNVNGMSDAEFAEYQRRNAAGGIVI